MILLKKGHTEHQAKTYKMFFQRFVDPAGRAIKKNRGVKFSSFESGKK